MERDKYKDDDLFMVTQDWDIKYVSSLYTEQDEVYNFLKKKCKDGTLRNHTNLLVYELIQKELKLPIPN